MFVAEKAISMQMLETQSIGHLQRTQKDVMNSKRMDTSKYSYKFLTWTLKQKFLLIIKHIVNNQMMSKINLGVYQKQNV